MQGFQAIIFDLDDTLYSERDYVRSGFQAVAAWVEAQMSIPRQQSFPELCQLFDEGVRGNTFNRWLEIHGNVSEEWVSAMVRVYREHNPSITLYPGVLDLLCHLRKRFHLGLVSDGYLEVQKKKFMALNLASSFDAVVFSDEFGRQAWKPSPKPFEVILQKLGIIGCEAIYVADNPTKDFLGAQQLGMETIRIRHPKGLYSHLEPPSAQHSPGTNVETFEHLVETLLREGKHR